MSFRPKKIFVKNENGAYTEITYQEYKTLKETDESFKKKKFVRVYVDTFVEFDDDGCNSLNAERRHIRYLRQLDAKHKLRTYGCIFIAKKSNVDAEAAMESNELIKKIHSCLNQLKPIEKEIITGLYFKELSEKEVAEIVGLSQSSVNRRKKTILKKLKKLMTE